MAVHANADTPEDAARARRFGAQGIGLCRTEHMFLGARRVLVENLVLATDDEERDAALAAMLPMQRDDFTRILAEMDGLPVTIRLIDPPLHEFLPDLTKLSVDVALEDEHGRSDPARHRLLAAVRAAHEQNPMLGLRGVRLGLVVPGLVAMQARAILEAAADRIEAGGDPRPEIMVPLVSTVGELARLRRELTGVAEQVESERGFAVPHRVGTMVEVPRAALTADQIASEADFFSFGTNDLTQMTWGLSRDDVEASLLPGVPQPGDLGGLAVRVTGHRRCRLSDHHRGDQRAEGTTRPHPRRLRRARRGPGLDPLLRGHRARLCLVLTVPHPRRQAGGGTRRTPRHEVNQLTRRSWGANLHQFRRTSAMRGTFDSGVTAARPRG